MSSSSPDNEEREGLLPDGSKDLAEAIQRKEAASMPASPYPRLTRAIVLPEMVSIKYLAEISGASLYTITLLMQELGIGGEVSRSIDFADAARILRHYGILAKRAD